MSILYRPRIVTARQLGLKFANLFGELGPERFVTGHHSAGPKDVSDSHCAELTRRYHAEHAAKGWGGLGYHYVLSRDGTIFCGRPVVLKGAHVGLHNTDNVGVLCHGTVGDKPTRAQQRALKWLLANAHTSRMPEAHRTDRPLSQAKRRGHNDWPGHESNACPGTHKRFYITGGKSR